MSKRRPITPPLDEKLFDEVVQSLQRPEIVTHPEIVAFVRRFLQFAEEDRQYARGVGPVPRPCEPLTTKLPSEQVVSLLDDLEERYEAAYYQKHPEPRQSAHI